MRTIAFVYHAHNTRLRGAPNARSTISVNQSSFREMKKKSDVMLASALDKFGWTFVSSRKFGKLRQVAKRIAILKLQLQEDVAKE